MVGHLGVFVKVLYFVQAFISKVGLRNVLGTISEFSVRSHFFGEFLTCHTFAKSLLEKVARYGNPQSAFPRREVRASDGSGPATATENEQLSGSIKAPSPTI